MSRNLKMIIVILCFIFCTISAQKKDSTSVTPTQQPPADTSGYVSPSLNEKTTFRTVDLFTVVLYSAPSEQEARNRAKYFSSKGYEVKLYSDPSFKKSKFKVTTGFFKKRLDAELFKRNLIVYLKNKKLWVKQIDLSMKELVLVSTQANKIKTNEGKENNKLNQASHINNSSITALLNTGAVIMIYGLSGDDENLKKLVQNDVPFIHSVFNTKGEVSEVSYDVHFPLSFSLYKKFFIAFKNTEKLTFDEVPVLITQPDRSRLQKIKDFTISSNSLDQDKKNAAISAVSKIDQQLVLKDFRIYLSYNNSAWFICGVEELK
jgi:DNA polymerase IIIc chi subunit